MLKQILLVVVSLLMVSACSKAASDPPPTGTVAALTQTSAATFPTLPPQTPTASLSPTPFISFTVKPAVDNLKVRMGPGYLFEAWGMAQQTDTLTVLGKAPGGEWINVETAQGIKGWAFAELLTSAVDLAQVPVQTPTEVVTLTGRVLDGNGTPIQGVGFEIKQGSETEALTNAVVTDANGEFFSFLPVGTSGTWTITQNAIACKSNVWSDSTCSTYKAGYTGTVEPKTLTVTLPPGSPLSFIWK
jgi:uncharacterized protein YgiM (DUF1202 family)